AVSPRGHGSARMERGLQGRVLPGARVRPWMLVALDALHGHELVVEPPGLSRRRPPLLRAERERVLILARDVPPLGDVLARLAHRLERKHLLHARVREPPAERGVPHGLVPARER